MGKIFVTIMCSMLFFGCGSNVQVQSDEPVVEQDETVVSLYYPVDNFDKDVTLKPFGIYIDPKTSPVQPERFKGYHTGSDVEMPGDLQTVDVPVYSIADGFVKLAKVVGGYGGVVVVEYNFDGQSYVALYGHLNIKSVDVAVGDKVLAGQQLAFLGKEYSIETDGERKHLHFAMKQGTVVDLTGYVNDESYLSEWIDPVDFFKSHEVVEPN